VCACAYVVSVREGDGLSDAHDASNLVQVAVPPVGDGRTHLPDVAGVHELGEIIHACVQEPRLSARACDDSEGTWAYFRRRGAARSTSTGS
jgi:hypothetical protein